MHPYHFLILPTSICIVPFSLITVVTANNLVRRLCKYLLLYSKVLSLLFCYEQIIMLYGGKRNCVPSIIGIGIGKIKPIETVASIEFSSSL